MTQRETVKSLLEMRLPVTLARLFDEGVGYCGRNRISELRKQGYVIGQRNGPRPSENAYLLIANSGETVSEESLSKYRAEGWHF